MLAQLEDSIALTEDERRGCVETADLFRLGVSPYYLSLIDPGHPYCPIRMQAIPVRAEAEAHLSWCSYCRKRYRFEEHLRRFVRQAAVEAMPPELKARLAALRTPL